MSVSRVLSIVIAVENVIDSVVHEPNLIFVSPSTSVKEAISQISKTDRILAIYQQKNGQLIPLTV